MSSVYQEKAEALNAETLESRKIAEIARMLIHKEEENARHERRIKDMDAEIKRLEEATLGNFYNDMCREECMPKSTGRSNF